MKRLLGGMNLRNKLMMTLVVFILVPLIFAGLLFYDQSSELVIEKTDKETDQVLNLVQQNVDRLLMQFESYLLSIYDQDEVIEHLSLLSNHPSSTSSTNIQERLNPYLRSFLLGQEQIDSVYLMPNNDHVYFADFKGSSYFLQELNRHPEWKRTISMAGGRVVWFPTYGRASISSSDQFGYYIPVGMQVRNVADVLQPIGTLILNVKTQTLDRIIGEVSISPNNVFMITDSQGKVVWHKNPELYGTDFRDEPFYQEAIHQSGKFITQRLNGELYRVGSTQSDYNNWYYFSFIPVSDLTEQSTNMKGFFISTIIAFTVLFVMLAWLTSHYITKPIRKMAIAMKRPNIDIVDIRTEKQSFDEIGQLQFAFNRMQRRIDELITEVRIVSEKEREAEVRALHAQINPHVLYNTLDTINWMAIERSQMDISSMITALGDIMRYAIRKHQKLVTVREELRWAENYSYLQKMRFEDRFDILFDVDESILDYKVPRLFLQPYLENSIIHGMEHTESGGLIRVEIQPDDKGRIRVVVQDNGIGISEEKLRLIRKKGTHGVGINNLDERLKLEYGQAYGVTLESLSGQGTMVVIMLPELRESATGGERHVDA